MCRFALVRSDQVLKPFEILQKFSLMVKGSRAPDGEGQEDGWGVAWMDEDLSWGLVRSVLPIWKDTARFRQIPQSRIFVLHARSASFLSHRGRLDYNQPFITGPFAFVFNGLLRGVKMPYPVHGEIGSQKIWTILSRLLRRMKPEQAIPHLKAIMDCHARTVHAMNIGLCDSKKMFAFSTQTSELDYYSLYLHMSPSLKILSSEPFDGCTFHPVPFDKVVSF